MRIETLNELRATVAHLQKVTQQVFDDGKDALATGDHVEIIKHFVDLRDVNAVIKNGREILSDLEDRFSKEYIPNIVASLREKTGQKPPFHIEGIGRVGVSYRFACSIVGDDKAVGHNWLKENGNAALVTETVNSSTLAAFAKDVVVNQGGSLPEDIFKVSSNPYTSITKG